MVAIAAHQFLPACQVRRADAPLLRRAGAYPAYPHGGLATAVSSKGELRPENGPVVVIVPGWLSESSQYRPMASYLRSKGLTTLIVPLKWLNWIPSLGGRSVRPILDRIDATINRALNEEEETFYESADEVLAYTFSDFFKEFINPKNGAQLPQDSSIKTNETTFFNISAKRVILIAHSAGGWICRILLGGKVPYDGRVYAASRYVTALVTLGTPHVCTDKLTKRNMDFVNENYPGAAEAELGVHYICVAGKFVQGDSQYGGLWKDFAWQSYELCCGRGDVWGDGVIPVDCAIGLEGAQHVILEGVEHFPSVRDKENRKWYGSPQVADKWFPLLASLTSQEKDIGLESSAI
ncbi:hypothetical protein GOP47_0012682 [Adiantum capillus-veneris]|uniref:GPI inositol-deacylase n=1 Tax=Adiantum capillus-veneris TaxID=13818 RepID=A0A9D4URD4_ADICA|nr:hypothetical protein GOP47_0012682 [Adiantum capillus-veneris]